MDLGLLEKSVDIPSLIENEEAYSKFQRRQVDTDFCKILVVNLSEEIINCSDGGKLRNTGRIDLRIGVRCDEDRQVENRGSRLRIDTPNVAGRSLGSSLLLRYPP